METWGILLVSSTFLYLVSGRSCLPAVLWNAWPLGGLRRSLNPASAPTQDTSMISPCILPLTLATTLANQLAFLTTLSALPCQALQQQVLDRVTLFLTQPINPEATCQFEKDLRQLLDHCG